MSKTNENSSVFGWPSIVLMVLLMPLGLVSCDRSENAQIQAAERFADAVTRNEDARRDSMIATHILREHFSNQYVVADNLRWFRSFYNFQEKKFIAGAKADLERDFTADLKGSLRDTNAVEETGIVKVKSAKPGEDYPAVFWMVKQRGKHWGVAMVTHGKTKVNFH